MRDSFKNINHILITGNGFDLALWLPTSYSDFIKAAQAVIESSDGHIRLNEVFPEKYDTLNKHYVLQESYDLSEIKRQSTNAWLQYFLWLDKSDENSGTEKKWVDFERDIHQLLVDVAHLKLEIDRFESETKSKFNLEIWRGGRSRKGVVSIHDASFDRLSNALQWKSTNVQDGMDGIRPDFDLKYKHQTPTAIVLHLYDELKVFAELFKTYLNNLVAPIFKGRNFKNLALHTSTKTTGIITFNYTPIAQLLQFREDSTRHLHGEVKGDSGIIFGIDSVNQQVDELGTDLLSVLGSDVLLFTKYFQSLFYRTFAAQFKQPIFHQPQWSYSFYGHSFDLSDRSYIKVIFDLVLLRNSGQRITIYHHSEESRASILRNLLDPRMLGDDAQEKIERLIAEGRLSFIEKKSLLPQD